MEKSWRANLFFVVLLVVLAIYSLGAGGADIGFGDILRLFSSENSIDEAKKNNFASNKAPKAHYGTIDRDAFG